MKKATLFLLISVLLSVISSSRALFAKDSSDLERNFASPPPSARPWVYWFWVNGNISREGITADLAAMARVGVGGVLVFSVGISAPEGPVDFMTPQWRKLAKHAVQEADRLGLRFSINNTDGWNSGGPWITAETGMKKIVWTQMQVKGPRELRQVIQQPQTLLNYYRDIVVLALPALAGGRVNTLESAVKVSSDLPNKDVNRLIDGNPATVVEFPSTNGWITKLQENGNGYFYTVPTDKKYYHYVIFEFPEAKTVRSLKVAGPAYTFLRGDTFFRVESSNDGVDYQQVREVDLGFSSNVTVAFDEVKAKFFKISFTNRVALTLSEIELSDAARVHYGEVKSAMAGVGCKYGGETSVLANYGQSPNEHPPSKFMVSSKTVVNITDRMDKGGRLEWDCPAGDWTIMRIGMTAGGNQNGPATRLGKGLDCDKLSSKGAQAQIAGFTAKLAQDMGNLTGKNFTYVENVSWESGSQTWTEEFAEEFRKRRGYDILPYLPVITGCGVMDSYDVSDRVLWDFRRTIADLIRYNYHGQFREILNNLNLGYLSEGAGPLQFMVDPLNYQAEADVPMGEFWHAVTLYEDNRASASVAHTYGKKFVGAEAFTANCLWKPAFYELKSLGDRAFCEGVNWYFFHNYGHQPWVDVTPGVTFSVWGWHFQRTNTWWEQSKAYLQYLNRCQYLLRQGLSVADICYYIGDDVPNRIAFREDAWLPIPDSYDYDGCNTEILKRFTVRNGRLTLPHGMTYRVLLLPNSRTIMPDALRKIHELVRDGAVVVGPKPLRSPSLQDYPQCDKQVRKLGAELWADCDGQNVKEHAFGKGKVIWGKNWKQIFTNLGVRPDFEYTLDGTNTILNYIHRRVGQQDIYFVANRESKAVNTVCTFRVNNKEPELWYPGTGRIRKPAIYEVKDNKIKVLIHLDPCGSVFVVFRKKANPLAIVSVKRDGKVIYGKDMKKPLPLPELYFDKEGMVIETDQQGVYELGTTDGRVREIKIDPFAKSFAMEGPWGVIFQPGRGAPEKAVFEQLTDWSKHSDQGIKYFSGTATYIKEVDLPTNLFSGSGRKIVLDLGKVKEIAEVKLNGTDLGIFWKPPFSVDVTKKLKPGNNKLEVRVTNLWVNRLIGDEQYPDDCEWHSQSGLIELVRWPEWLLKGQSRPEQRRITFTNVKGYNKDSPLCESGLLGPVELKLLIRRRYE